MSCRGKIVLVEDDHDDREVFESLIKDISLANEVRHFEEAFSAFEYLKSTQDDIFLIFSDINMPQKNGLEFKRDIDTDPKLRRRSIPFLFYSTNASRGDIEEAYLTLTVQGFFLKGTRYSEMKTILATICEYWKTSEHPNT